MSSLKNHKIGIFIPVRLSSKRFPAKAIANTEFGKAIEILIKNLSLKYIKKKDIVICSTKEKVDNKLKIFAKKNKCKFFSGSKLNIINRFYLANLKYKYDYIVEVDGDDIMTDFKYVDICINTLHLKKLDFVYTSNLPIGMNCKVFTSKALKITNNVNLSNDNSNGFMSLFYKNPLLSKKKINFKGFEIPKVRLTLDYAEDLKFFEILLLLVKIKKYKPNLKNYFKILKHNKDISRINYFRNYDYKLNTNKMKSLKIKIGEKFKKIFIN